MSTAWPHGKLEFKTAVEIPGMSETPGIAVDPATWQLPHAFVADPATDVCRCGVGGGDSEPELEAHAVDMSSMLDAKEMTAMFAALDAGHFTVADELLKKAEERYGETKSATGCAYCDAKAICKVTAAGEATAAVMACAKHKPMAMAAAKLKGGGQAPTADAYPAVDMAPAARGGTKVAGVDTHPAGAERLRMYWAHGPGAAKVRWGEKGDFDRCVALLTPYLKDEEKAKGYCFAPETEILTRDGVVRIGDVADTDQLVLTAPVPGPSGAPVRGDGHWAQAPIRSYGEQRLLSVTLTRNKVRKTIRATPEHVWYASPDSKSRRRGDVSALPTSELRPGMALAGLLPMPVTLRSSPSPFGVAAGFVFGDGHREAGKGCRVDLWGEKDAALLPYFAGCPTSPVKTIAGVEGVRIAGIPASWKALPALDEGVPYLLGWLAGYIAADGTVSKSGRVDLYSARRDHLDFAATVANRLGIASYGVVSYSRVGLGSDVSTPMYRLTFTGSTVPPSLLVIPEHRRRFDAAAPSQTPVRWRVESVVDHGDVEEVFCAEVPSTHTFALADYVWVHNCNLRHHESTGMWPAEHAKMEKGKALPEGVSGWAAFAESKVDPAAAQAARQARQARMQRAAARAAASAATAGSSFNQAHPRNRGKFAPKGSTTVGAAPAAGAAGGNPFDAMSAGIAAQGQAHLQAVSAATALKASKAAATANRQAAAAVAKAQRTQTAHDRQVARYLSSVARAKTRAANLHAAGVRKANAATAKAAKVKATGAKAGVPLNSAQMTAVQTRLAKLYPSAKIKVEGINNGATTHAIRLFQSQNGLPVTGVINRATYAALSNPKSVSHDAGPAPKVSVAPVAAGASGGGVRAVGTATAAPSAAFLANLTRIQAAAAAARHGNAPKALPTPSGTKVFAPTKETP